MQLSLRSGVVGGCSLTTTAGSDDALSGATVVVAADGDASADAIDVNFPGVGTGVFRSDEESGEPKMDESKSGVLQYGELLSIGGMGSMPSGCRRVSPSRSSALGRKSWLACDVSSTRWSWGGSSGNWYSRTCC